MKPRWTLIVVILAAFIFAVAETVSKLRINGKAYSSAPILVKGETYVPLKALQAAGMQVANDGTTLSLTFIPSGGANQINALEGGVNDWLFNGIWRFRVTSIAAAAEGAGWDVKVELRNGTKQDDLALSGTGFDSVKLVLDDGKMLESRGVVDLANKSFQQGGGETFTLNFVDDTDGIPTHKPDKVILLIRPDADLKKYLRDRMKISYAVEDPSFRIKVGTQ